MEIKVKVELGLTPQLAKMVERFFDGKGSFRTLTFSSLPEKGEPEREQPETAAEPAEPEQTETTGPGTTAEPLPEEREEATEPEPAEPERPERRSQPGEVTPPTDQEMRDLMDIAISRLAGNGWKESGDPKTIAIRKGCTKAFKQIAAHLGAEKPTALQGDARTRFIEHLGEIVIDTKDNSVEWLPF